MKKNGLLLHKKYGIAGIPLKPRARSDTALCVSVRDMTLFVHRIRTDVLTKMSRILMRFFVQLVHLPAIRQPSQVGFCTCLLCTLPKKGQRAKMNFKTIAYSVFLCYLVPKQIFLCGS